jgi:hypothetical protein
MHGHNQNIDSLFRKVFAIGLFLFLLTIFKSNDCFSDGQFNTSAAIENASGADFSAILTTPVSCPSYNYSLASCHLVTLNNGNPDSFRILVSNTRTDHLLLLGKERYLKIKPQIMACRTHCIRATLHGGEIPLIS